MSNLATLRESRESFGSATESQSTTRRNSVVSQASDRRDSNASAKSATSGLSRKISFKSLTARKSKEETEEKDSGSEMKRAGSLRRDASVRWVYCWLSLKVSLSNALDLVN